MAIKVQVSKSKLVDLDLPVTATVAELKKSFENKNKKFYVTRQSFKFNGAKETVVRLSDDKKTLKEYGVTETTTLIFKDLGPQIGYRTVFVWEYLGPILIMLLYAMRPTFIYGVEAANAEYNAVAKLGIYCWIIHFMKREFETFFVHKFSRPTMPFFNLFKNSGYYWGFATIVGYPLCHPAFTAPGDMDSLAVKIGLIIFAISELGNLTCHVMLRNLRPAAGSKLRPIPKGFLFNYVSCPNYTFEVAGWVGFSIMTGILASYAFTFVGFMQMYDWAKGKHAGYLKTYGDEYKKLRRSVMIPFVL